MGDERAGALGSALAVQSPALTFVRFESLGMTTQDVGDVLKHALAAPEQQQAQLLAHLLASLEAQPQAVLVSLHLIASRL